MNYIHDRITVMNHCSDVAMGHVDRDHVRVHFLKPAAPAVSASVFASAIPDCLVNGAYNYLQFTIHVDGARLHKRWGLSPFNIKQNWFHFISLLRRWGSGTKERLGENNITADKRGDSPWQRRFKENFKGETLLRVIV